MSVEPAAAATPAPVAPADQADPSLEAGLPAAPVPATPAVLAARATERRRQRIRLAALVLVFVALFGVGYGLGLDEYVEAERIRALVESWGALGPLAFIVIFALGELMHVPGGVFVAGAIVIWGPYVGGLIGFVGANVSVAFSFVFVRTIGGKALDTIERPLVRRLLARIDEHPVLVVAALRSIFFALPALNYALALTRIRFRDHALGSALGLIPQLIGIAVIVSTALGR